jgi:hypothetical protein
MFRVKAELKSTSEISFGKPIREKKIENEDYDQFEERIWRLRAHTQNNHVVIPPTMFKGALEEAAKYLSLKISGGRGATYTKHFKAGIVVENCIELDISPKELEPQWVHVPADGKKGGGSRVYKCFPLIHSWKGELFVTILDSKITMGVFEEVLKAAGVFIGIGTFRPINGGYHGRFSVESIKEVKQ